MELTIERMVEVYQIHKSKEGKIRVYETIVKRPEHYKFVVEHKAEILAYLDAKEVAAKRAHDERMAKLNAIEGLRELEDAKYALKSYYSSYNRYIEQGAEGKEPEKPEANLDELIRKYPRANAYLKAKEYSFASHFAKSRAGDRAEERILNGEDYNQAIDDMEKEWKDYCDEHMWDN